MAILIVIYCQEFPGIKINTGPKQVNTNHKLQPRSRRCPCPLFLLTPSGAVQADMPGGLGQSGRDAIKPTSCVPDKKAPAFLDNKHPPVL